MSNRLMTQFGYTV
ncbi:hypothetical protein CGLO_10468 [Colletotrichum gloeosporioides Cg-14]|uniref:Uncharacterized protein n=1 Tax=Colletotrichum gloeosporioides (strain Cg-14) TaxID=1237896 RepID=T0KDE5_COLGC|nr:hypothetical protein CGLO_10468 [Colletotrichum gloeosporioides Cg-14]